MAVTPTWTNLNGLDVLSISIKRGRNHQLDRIEAGEAIIELNNSSGNYWPDNAAGPYYGYILPGKKFNIRATYSSTYDLFTGYISRWPPSFMSQGGAGPIVTVTCRDIQNKLAQFLMNNAGEVEELSGTRVGNVLDEYGFPAADRLLDAGQSTMIATGAQVNVNAMSHLFTVQDSEFGIIFQQPDGDVEFQDRHARLFSPYNTSQATFGNDGAELRYCDLVVDQDEKDVINDVHIKRSGGTQQDASDATSQSTYGIASMSKTGLLMTTDNEALDQANYLCNKYKDSVMRVKAIIIRPQADPANLWPKVLGYDISTRITLRLDMASIDRDYHIEGISHTVDFRRGTWETRWELSDADSQEYWVLDESILGTNTRLAY